MKRLNLKTCLSHILIMSLILFAVSCDEDNKDDNSDNEIIEDSNKVTFEESLINIPTQIEEESDRYEIDKEMIGITVFESDSPQNEQTGMLKNLFPGGDFSNAEASEVFDSYNIEYNGKSYSAVFVYEQNDKEEFVIHTVFIHKRPFSEDILAKIFS